MHQSLLAGLLSHVGVRDEQQREYAGARGTRFGISPGSALFRKQPQFVMAEELVETSRLWARMNARIDPVWAEQLGGAPRQAAVLRAALVGQAGVGRRHRARDALRRAARRRARSSGWAGLDPELARDLFIRHALVEGDWPTEHAFLRDNAALIERLAELEARTRRRDIVVDDSTLIAFYDKRIPAEVVSGRHFDSWWKKARRQTPGPADLHRGAAAARDAAGSIADEDYPTTWTQGENVLPVTYQFEPGSEQDGVTVHIPVDRLNQVTRRRLRLAGARLPRGARHRADPLAAQGNPPQPRAGARPCPGRAARARPDEGTAAARRSPRSSSVAPASRSPPADFEVERVPSAPAGDLQRRWAGRASRSRRARTSRPCATRRRRSCGGR